jgi:hypothetical protein
MAVSPAGQPTSLSKQEYFRNFIDSRFESYSFVNYLTYCSYGIFGGGRLHLKGFLAEGIGAINFDLWN